MLKRIIQYFRKKEEKKQTEVGTTVFSCIHVEVFPFKVLLCNGYSYDEICEELKKQGCDEWLMAFKSNGTEEIIKNGDGYFAFLRTIYIEEIKKKSTFCFIILDKFDFNDWYYCKLAHEVLHICQFILPEFFDIEREYESFAYVHTYLFEQCLKKLRNDKTESDG